MLDFLLRRGRRPSPKDPDLASARREGGGGSAVLSLRDVPPGGRCRVVRLRARGAVRQRLMNLGFVPSAIVIVVRRAPLNDPMEIRLGDDLVSLRREEAAQIEVAAEG